VIPFAFVATGCALGTKCLKAGQAFAHMTFPESPSWKSVARRKRSIDRVRSGSVFRAVLLQSKRSVVRHLSRPRTIDTEFTAEIPKPRITVKDRSTSRRSIESGRQTGLNRSLTGRSRSTCRRKQQTVFSMARRGVIFRPILRTKDRADRPCRPSGTDDEPQPVSVGLTDAAITRPRIRRYRRQSPVSLRPALDLHRFRSRLRLRPNSRCTWR